MISDSKETCHPKFSVPTFKCMNMMAILIYEYLYGSIGFKKTAAFLRTFLSKTGRNKTITTKNIISFVHFLMITEW
jgi:hypothetical protein